MSPLWGEMRRSHLDFLGGLVSAGVCFLVAGLSSDARCVLFLLLGGLKSDAESCTLRGGLKSAPATPPNLPEPDLLGGLKSDGS